MVNKPIVLVARFLKVDGMALFPVILVRSKELLKDDVLIRHESIHLLQEAELLVVPFYLLYAFNYLVNLIRFKNHHKAYLNICFEREAYANEANKGYLQQRKWWAWVKYL
ncbi:hypothetical protein MUY27_12955 [Mucilaginibacter sp. RS28]|uniref:DUF4157 domain-containing protein n=1 Tax=Mucilaginibacter straminoryzae TaxID=2932774 RepID=A0A9X1X561_9SPHI|nr:hypothetical protein [Mucilaginibacter straminoryzae]MCJ8210620.1 hypothetical protein [Mucilaginibacter straminoryzae]